MATTWTIAIDWDKNSNYTDTYDDVTSRVISASWFLGMRQPYQEVADNSALTLTLRNDDRRYSPEYASSPLYGLMQPLRPVRIQSNDGTTTRTPWTGCIESIQPAVNKNGQRIVNIVATGPMQFFTAAETKTILHENKRADEVVSALLAEVPNAPQSSLQLGSSVFPMVGDNWVRQGGYTDAEKDTFDVYRAINDVVAAERGRFIYDREGRAVFWSRRHLLTEWPVAATFDDGMTQLNYVYAGIDQLKNEVIVACQPRKVSGTDQDILWQLEGSIIPVPAQGTRKFYVKYQDEDGNRVGAYTGSVTLTGVTFEQGTATWQLNEKASGVEIVFTNGGGLEAWVKTATVRGKRITAFDRLEATAKNETSITNYGKRTMRMNLPCLTRLEDAQAVADFEVNRRGQPRGQVSSMVVRSHGQKGGSYHAQQLALTLGDRIQVEETQSSHSGSYHIIGEAHSLSQGATLYETTWYLEPTPTTYVSPWILDDTTYSKLGTTTVLVY